MLINRNKEPPIKESNAYDSRLVRGRRQKSSQPPQLIEIPKTIQYLVKRLTKPFLGLKYSMITMVMFSSGRNKEKQDKIVGCEKKIKRTSCFHSYSVTNNESSEK
jgi:hypothetical protein